MGNLLVTIKVREIDKEKMMNECVNEFLRHHPEFDGAMITQSFMFKKLVNHYAGD